MKRRFSVERPLTLLTVLGHDVEIATAPSRGQGRRPRSVWWRKGIAGDDGPVASLANIHRLRMAHQLLS